MSKQIVSDDVYKVVQDEVSHFKGLTSNYIINHYIKGPKDVIVWFRGATVQIFGDSEAYERDIVKLRASILADALEMANKKHGGLLDQLDLFMPVSFGDTNEQHLQEIPALVFSKTAFSNNILIPSETALMGYPEVDFVRTDDKPLSRKLNTICFVGSLTGRTATLEDIKNNQRLRLAAQSAGNFNYFCKIIKAPRADSESFEATISQCQTVYPELKDHDHIFLNQEERVDLGEQLNYKFQACIDGHTCPWARLPWQMAANTIPLKIRNFKNAWREWYYPLLNPSKHFLELDIEYLEDAYHFLVENPEIQHDINEAGKDFVKQYLSYETTLDVLAQTLLLLSEQQDNIYVHKLEAIAKKQEQEQCLAQ